jgi:hypothetical protein
MTTTGIPAIDEARLVLPVVMLPNDLHASAPIETNGITTFHTVSAPPPSVRHGRTGTGHRTCRKTAT